MGGNARRAAESELLTQKAGMKLESGALTNAHDVEVDWTTGHWTFKDLGDMASYQ